MRIIRISDTMASTTLLKNLLEGDVIVHCGDFTEDGTEEEDIIGQLAAES